MRLPRLTEARAPLTREVHTVNEHGERETISIPAERPLTVYVDKRELVTLMTLGARPEWLVLGYLRNQRLVAEVMKGNFLDRHVPTIRALYKQQCEAMLAALTKEMQGLDVHWNRPDGGMFLWVRLPEGMSAIDLLPKAVERNVAFVPGAAFYADNADPRTLRLSFVTSTAEQIATGQRCASATLHFSARR